jgi:hypothetical protein
MWSPYFPVIQLFDDEATPGLRVLRSLMKVLRPRKVETVKSGIIVPD